jgi:mono/diheme cytochrome c family protein
MSEPMHDPSPRDPNEMDLAKVHGSILRENKEPVEGYKSVPLWLVTLIMVFTFWGGIYLAYYSGGFRADAFVPRKSMAGPVLDPNDPATMGQRVYTQSCILCHQASGTGVPRIYPPLAGSEWVLAKDWRGDNHLVSIVLHGLQGPVDVAGNSYNGSMPGWKTLSDAEVAAVLTYIRSQWGNAAPPISAEFVGTVRYKTRRRTTVWATGELQSLAKESAPKVVPVMKARR